MMPKLGTAKNGKEVVVLSDSGLMPPHDLNMEKCVLGALLIDLNAFSRVADILKEDMFYDKNHREVFKAIKELSVEGIGIDMMTVGDRLRRNGLSMENLCVELSMSVNSSVHVVYHSETLKEMFMYRQIISFCAEAESEAFERKLPVRDMLQKVENGLYSLALEQDRQSVGDMKTMLLNAAKDIEAASQRNGLSGIESGFNYLDKKTSGWQKSDLIIIAARPAMGKTALLLSMAKNMIEQQHPVLIFSLEMSQSQLMQRLITNATELPANRIKSGKLNNADWMILNNQMALLEKMPLYIDDSANLTIFEMATKARRMVKEQGIECIFIDYLQLMRAEGKNISNREQEVSTISRALKQLAKELDIPVIALSQLNRGVEARSGDNKRPMLSDLRESGAIEQDADLVLLLHRPEYYGMMIDEEGNSTIGLAELIIAKNRNGATGTIKLHFEADLIKFTNYEEYAGSPMGFQEVNLQTTSKKEQPKEEKPKRGSKKKIERIQTEDLDELEDDDEDEDWDVIKK